jgi:hypothetical protein
VRQIVALCSEDGSQINKKARNLPEVKKVEDKWNAGVWDLREW